MSDKLTESLMAVDAETIATLRRQLAEYQSKWDTLAKLCNDRDDQRLEAVAKLAATERQLAEARAARPEEETADWAWQQVVDAFGKIWPGDNHYNDDPCELIYRLRDERDDANAQFAAASVENDRMRLNISEKRYVDMTPDDGLVSRILSAYLDDTMATDNTLGLPPDNPICITMNEATAKRNAILRTALTAPAAASIREAGLREALGWYADKNTWSNAECDKLNADGGFFPYGLDSCPISNDLGDRARAALAAPDDGVVKRIVSLIRKTITDSKAFTWKGEILDEAAALLRELGG